jgi:phage-related holin
MAAVMKIIVVWDVISCSLVDSILEAHGVTSQKEIIYILFYLKKMC